MSRDELLDVLKREIGAVLFDKYGIILSPDTNLIAEAALSAIEQAGMVVVPDAALKWLNGEGPDEAGHWFGDAPEDVPVGRRAFWWRSKFTRMIEAGRIE
jgi:hypothetical protein